MMMLVMLMSAGLSAQAHKVNMFAFAEGNEVFVEGYFTDGKKPKKCEVIVYDVKDKALLTGMRSGRWWHGRYCRAGMSAAIEFCSS